MQKYLNMFVHKVRATIELNEVSSTQLSISMDLSLIVSPVDISAGRTWTVLCQGNDTVPAEQHWMLFRSSLTLAPSPQITPFSILSLEKELERQQ